jgi:hypothetical protein
MKVLIACEFSGIVREAFRKRGHDAWSCDLLDTEIPGQHIKGDILEILNDGWDLMIAHPPCTRLANSGVRWIWEYNLLDEVYESCQFFNRLLNAQINKIVVENPIQHKYARVHIRKYDQIIQPWQFGHPETKATCLWLKNLPLLIPTNIVEGREGRVWKESPGPYRWKNRSRTYQGIANAMAAQWG